MFKLSAECDCDEVYVVDAEAFSDLVHAGTPLDALKLSIDKWKFIERVLQDEKRDRPVDDGGADTCACCLHAMGCYDCLIKEYTGRWVCEGTPYAAFTETAWVDEQQELATRMVVLLTKIYEHYLAKEEG